MKSGSVATLALCGSQTRPKAKVGDLIVRVTGRKMKVPKHCDCNGNKELAKKSSASSVVSRYSVADAVEEKSSSA